jgi:hypothetical protein
MVSIDCGRFDRVRKDIDEKRREVNLLNENGKRHLLQIAEEDRAITREIGRLASNLTFLERLRPRGGRRPSDDLGDAQRLLSFEDARRKLEELQSRKHELAVEAWEIRLQLDQVERRLTDLRNEELTNRRLAQEAGCQP